ncbi:choline sulfate utilization transcriptional regulator [Halomonas heilongjiangensis]|uniref:LysR family transcriptional regulator n=1 Tax=Halomonas heilongjiangensis TaxID=1387883 RepID=A0A2N7TQ71_9GAMM|nr:LysR substrate-binding domain-containing protein [Halomonas heilongjiangensis]PMR70344.1 LysR family transcriptional regulator [Halomonas heilongjiangensis]PXX87363.1 LysR family transcriptional regulator [Halomonas heilongjiangensis]
MSWIGRAASPNGLRVFEAAARHLSFTAAARELRSTQSAVSQQVRALEEQLGLPLFERIYRGVRLTEAGQALFVSVQEGFATIDRTIDRLQHRHRHPHVNILTDFSFAAYWLMPRLPRFRERHPHIDVRIVTNQGVLDWRTQEVDVAIVFCDERTLAAGVPRLFHEEVFPVCSPGFLQQHGPIESPERLAELPLLTLTADQGQSWLDWPSYFAQLAGIGYLESSELTFNNYTLLIQAAIAGQGIGMGWRGLVDDLLDGGMLVGLHGLALRSPRGYGLIDAQPEASSEAKRALQEWVLAGAAQPRDACEGEVGRTRAE